LSRRERGECMAQRGPAGGNESDADTPRSVDHDQGVDVGDAVELGNLAVGVGEVGDVAGGAEASAEIGEVAGAAATGKVERYEPHAWSRGRERGVAAHFVDARPASGLHEREHGRVP